MTCPACSQLLLVLGLVALKKPDGEVASQNKVLNIWGCLATKSHKKPQKATKVLERPGIAQFLICQEWMN
jgi:hypothetical protein